VTSHEQIEVEIPAYLAGRLDAGSARRVREHLDGCRECAAVAEFWSRLVTPQAFQAPEPDSEHPSCASLRAAAQGRAGHDPGLEGHLRACPSCALEVELWRRQRSRPPRRSDQRWVQAAAAGLVVGLGLGALGYGLLDRGRAARFEAGATRTAAPLVVLRSPQRSDEGTAEVRIPPETRFLAIAVQPEVSGDLPSDALVRLVVRAESGSAAGSAVTTVGDLRRSLATGEGVATFVLPADGLTEGRYVLSLTAEGEPESPIAEIPFHVRR